MKDIVYRETIKFDEKVESILKLINKPKSPSQPFTESTNMITNLIVDVDQK